MSREANPRPSVPQHGPGPPATLSSMEHSSPNQVTSEIQQLRQELQLCMGKIKGYETLGHLFQESKQECIRYKQKNEELAKKLDSLTRCILPVEAVTSVPCGGGSETKLDIETSSSSLPPTDGTSRSVTLEGLIVKTPPTKSPVISPDASSSDSPSFIQISSSYAGSMTSFPSNTSGDVIRKQSNQQQSQQEQQLGNTADAGVATLDSGELSYEIKQITDHLRNVGHDGGTTKEDLASDLIKAGVNVIKLQKQNRLLEVMLSQVKEQLVKLEADNDTKQQTILMLQKECDYLTKMAKARNQAVIGNPVKGSDQDESTRGGLDSCEWVEVMENQITSDAIAGADGGQITVTTVPLVEKELRHRIEKLSATISELLSVNRNWDEHCRQQELNHSQQVNALNVKLSEVQCQSDQQRQLEIDNIVLTAKKQREAEELAKDEAISELHVERQRRAESEHKCFELNRKITELEHKLQLQQNPSQVESASRTPWDQQTIQPSPIREQELQTQLLILQEQVNVFKEDFDQERLDRELARTKLDSYRKQSRDLSDQLKACRAELSQANVELKTARSESDRWRQSYVKLSSSLQALQRQARPVETRQMSSAMPSLYSEAAVVQQRQSRSNIIQVPNWTCVHCTFSNLGQKHSCEMCGQTKRGDLMQQYTASTVAGGRSVAGLQSFHPDMPYHTSLDTPSLETDRADSSQFKSTGCDSQRLN